MRSLLDEGRGYRKADARRAADDQGDLVGEERRVFGGRRHDAMIE